MGVVEVFVENVLDHTDSAPVLTVENFEDTITVAVEDASDQQPTRHEDPDRGADMCPAWQSFPRFVVRGAAPRPRRARRLGRGWSRKQVLTPRPACRVSPVPGPGYALIARGNGARWEFPNSEGNLR